MASHISLKLYMTMIKRDVPVTAIGNLFTLPSRPGVLVIKGVCNHAFSALVLWSWGKFRISSLTLQLPPHMTVRGCSPQRREQQVCPEMLMETDLLRLML